MVKTFEGKYLLMKKWLVLFVAILATVSLTVCHAENAMSDEGVAIGDVVSFGSYEQDNNMDNGPEPIEWVVLDVREGNVLLISQYGLAIMQFDSEIVMTSETSRDDEIFWETSTVRKWLNEDFLSSAFSENEQSAIQVTTVDNSGAQSSDGVESGTDTEDRVFLLSYLEANHYFDVVKLPKGEVEPNEKGTAEATAYAIAQHNKKYSEPIDANENGRAMCGWWLRTHDIQLLHGIYVTNNGFFDNQWIDYPDYAVRPAIWVSAAALKDSVIKGTAGRSSDMNLDIEGDWILIGSNSDWANEHLADGSYEATLSFHDGEYISKQILSGEETVDSGEYHFEGGKLYLGTSEPADIMIDGDVLTITSGSSILKLQRK